MSIYPNITEQDLNNLCKIAEKQKNHGAFSIKIETLKQTHEKKLAEPFAPVTKKLREVFGKTSEHLKQLQKILNLF